MRQWKAAILFVFGLFFLACDEGPQGALCDLDCGKGLCTISATGSERCICSEGYKADSSGKCADCVEGYSLVSGVCIKDPCTNFCVGSNEMCVLLAGAPECRCADGFERVGTECRVSDACFVHFSFSNQYAADFKVFVTGSFDNWEHKTHEMQNSGGGEFKLSMGLAPGTYTYKFYVEGWGDNSWHVDTSRATQGDGNNVLHVGACGEGNPTVDPIDETIPQLKLLSVPQVSGGNIHFEVQYVDAKDGGGIDGEAVVKLGDSVVSSTFDAASQVITVNDTGKQQGKYAYFVEASSKNGKSAKPLFVPVWVEDKVFDWRDALLYFAFTDRFLNGDTSNDDPKTNATNAGTCDARWLGGDFAGLQKKIEEGYFDELGVNTLWISSVSMNGQGLGSGDDGKQYSAYHSYWPVSTGWMGENADVFANATSADIPIVPIEPHFGSFDELKSLIGACHKRGIRVLIDFAANHVHEDSPVYKKHKEYFNTSEVHICNGDNGANWNKYPIICWFAPNLPDFNYEVPEARRLMVEHAKWLIRETNIDGFRVDAVKHMTKQFVVDLRHGIDEMFKNTGLTFYMVGETFEFNADQLKEYIGKDYLHGQFDFGFYGQIKDHILSIPHENAKFYHIKNFTEGNDTTYDSVNGMKAIMGTFLGNHDVARAISVANGNSQAQWVQNPDVDDWQAHLRLKLAWTVLLTSPGVPLIYYGDEYGMEGANDPDNRRMMQFDNFREQQGITLSFVKSLGNIRRDHSVLSRGKRTNINANDDAWLYKMSDGESSIWVGVSRSDNTGFDIQGPANGWIDLLNNNADVSSRSRIQFNAGNQIIIWKEK